MKRIFYNQDNKALYLFSESHACYIANNKKTLHKDFDYYIRGVIEGNRLFLRLYYPYNDIDERTFTEIKQASNILLSEVQADIIKELKKHDIEISETVKNVSNEDLKSLLNVQCV